MDALNARDELNLFIDSANAPIFGVDSHGIVNEWNPVTAATTGYPKEEALGSHFADRFIDDDHKEAVGQILASALEGSGTANYELALRNRAGRRIEILLNATTRRNSLGKVIGVIGVGQDMTRFREQEKTLQQSQKMESLGQLTGGIAHDFNNLHAVIQGNLDLANENLDNLDERTFVTECLKDAATATTDATNLTNQLLAFSSHQSPQKNIVNLASLASETFRKASEKLASGKTLSIDCDRVDFEAVIDSAQLENSILELIANADEATGTDGRISFSIYAEEDNREAGATSNRTPSEHLFICVSDDGCGISEDGLFKATDPFYTTKGVGEGVGLGLSKVHSFAKKSGGQLQIESEMGVGTTVKLTLPMIRKTEEREEVHPAVNEGNPSHEGQTILLVEDEHRLRELAARHLRSTGYEVIESVDAEDALRVLEGNNREIDILFSDIRMPGNLSGRQLARKVAEIYPRVRIVLTTAYEEESELPDGEDPGQGPPILRKPYSRSNLIKAVTDTA
ncbi:MAG: PAS domain-containing protein [Myxococcota bacterium]|nr:PAS domain-containing protein [Myxococcota bacterium]